MNFSIFKIIARQRLLKNESTFLLWSLYHLLFWRRLRGALSGGTFAFFGLRAIQKINWRPHKKFWARFGTLWSENCIYKKLCKPHELKIASSVEPSRILKKLFLLPLFTIFLERQLRKNYINFRGRHVRAWAQAPTADACSSFSLEVGSYQHPYLVD